MLMRVFLGWRGERGHGMVAIPTLEEEDARRPSREREKLVGEKTRIINTIRRRCSVWESAGSTPL
jgi:transposase